MLSQHGCRFASGSLKEKTPPSFTMDSKPFTPEVARKIIMSLQKPAVFQNMTTDWPALHWTAQHLSSCLTEKMRFRLGKRTHDTVPQFETQCSYIEANLTEFLSWCDGDAEASSGPFAAHNSRDFWAYADYKYIAHLFQDKPAKFQELLWSDFGFPGRDGRDSTLWIGTRGANTPCHLDSYGCNLVFQIQGRKRWRLFPPDDTPRLYPTRLPYEESSVFSRVSVPRPHLQEFPAFTHAHAHSVTLQPGQVLFVPRHWWHYVESVDALTVSVNSWIELDEDHEARVGEALTKTIVFALKKPPSSDNQDHWLNPTEDGDSTHEENMEYVNLAVKACLEKRRGDQDTSRKRDLTGRMKIPASFSVPFGPHLTPVEGDGQSKEKEPRSENAAQQEETTRDGPEGGASVHISTNDVLDCLVHPDVIALVTRLMMSRQRELYA